jgi:hypothetical protein
MPIERRSPLPVGRYWVDIIDRRGEVLEFDGWIKRGVAAGKLALIKREDKGTTTWSLDYSGVRYTFYLFDVLEPVEWPKNKRWGYPTIARSEAHPEAPKIETADDTGVRPTVPSPIETINDFLGSAKTLALVALGVYVYFQLDKKRN